MPEEADRPLQAALDGLDGDPKTESRLLTHMARARLDQNELEEACRLAVNSLDIAQQSGSSIGVADIHDFRRDLTPWKETDSVRRLDERLAIPI